MTYICGGQKRDRDRRGAGIVADGGVQRQQDHIRERRGIGDRTVRVNQLSHEKWNAGGNL